MTSYVSPVAFTTVAQSIPPNVFADMDRKVAAAVAGGADVIDLAKGNPDAFPADFIREVAKKAVDDPANARYSPFDGKPSFLQAAEQWYRNTYGVEVDWKTQLFAVEGAVDGFGCVVRRACFAGRCCGICGSILPLIPLHDGDEPS